MLESFINILIVYYFILTDKKELFYDGPFNFTTTMANWYVFSNFCDVFNINVAILLQLQKNAFDVTPKA